MKQAVETVDLWHAMSDLYLDNEMTVEDYLYVASTLARSDKSIEELESIFFYEVHPVLYMNLLAVAGHWGEFGKEWLGDQITQYLETQHRGVHKRGWLVKMREKEEEHKSENVKIMVRCSWEKVKLLIEVIRTRGLA